MSLSCRRDVDSIDQWAQTKNENAVLSTYPSDTGDMQLDGEGHSGHSTSRQVSPCHSRTDSDELVLASHLERIRYARVPVTPFDPSFPELTGVRELGTVPVMCRKSSFSEGGMVRHDAADEINIPSITSTPMLHPFWVRVPSVHAVSRLHHTTTHRRGSSLRAQSSIIVKYRMAADLTCFGWGAQAAGVSFSRGHRVLRVPYDCCTPNLFDGEEFSMAVRCAPC